MDLIFVGAFLAVSSNTRYQIINGLERLVEASPVAKRVPAASLAFTVGVRFANNVYGGMQFVDWARMSGCQWGASFHFHGENLPSLLLYVSPPINVTLFLMQPMAKIMPITQICFLLQSPFTEMLCCCCLLSGICYFIQIRRIFIMIKSKMYKYLGDRRSQK